MQADQALLVAGTRHPRWLPFTIEHSDVSQILIRVNDDMINFDKKITVIYEGGILFKDKVSRETETIQKTFRERHDPTAVFSAEIEIDIPQS